MPKSSIKGNLFSFIHLAYEVKNPSHHESILERLERKESKQGQRLEET